jgi:CDP-paratose 2-epimerase
MSTLGITVAVTPALPDAERLLADLATDMRAVRARELRILISQTDWRCPGVREWHRRFAARASEFATLTIALRRGNAAPAYVDDVQGYAEFVRDASTVFGTAAPWLELTDLLGSAAWPERTPAGKDLIATIARTISQRLSLGGLPLAQEWLADASDKGFFECVDALAFRDAEADGATLEVLRRSPAEVWLTLTDCDVAPPDTLVRNVHAALALPVTRTFIGAPGPAMNPLRSLDGKPALLARLLMNERHMLSTLAPNVPVPRTAHPAPANDLIVGGAGFVGCNLAARLADDGRAVRILDDLSRPGTEQNASWLLARYPGQVQLMLGDVRDFARVASVMQGVQRVFHFAAQTAVTTSLTHVHDDHTTNATGTLNVLEAARRQPQPPAVIFTSTNKVYGDLQDVALECTYAGHLPADPALRSNGIDESRPLCFRSPYGCSKGAADQYVQDYAHTFGLPAVVLRMSCIYGPRQFGNEDQGWVAHFARQLLTGQPVTLYGDGLQVRDVLFVDDLVDALLAVSTHRLALTGHAYNVGGGPRNAVSLRMVVSRLAALHGAAPDVRVADWRPGDQRFYVSDTRKLHAATGWAPRTDVDSGLAALYQWMRAQLGDRVVDPARGCRAMAAGGAQQGRIAL